MFNRSFVIVCTSILLLGFLTSFIPPKKKVLFFGDSITELGVNKIGYITVLKTKLDTNSYDLVGKGISGNKIYDLYLRLKEDVIDLNPQTVVIYVGVNDVWHKSLLKTGTDYDKFIKFYQALITNIKSTGANVIVCTPAVIGEKKNSGNTMDAELDKYSEAIRQLASKNNVKLCDLRKLFTTYIQENNVDNEDKNILTYDGVHLNELGNKMVAESLLDLIQ